MSAAQNSSKRQRVAARQRMTYRDQVLQVVKARFAAAPAGKSAPALRLPATMESNGEAPSIISQALWRLGHLQGMLLLMDLRDRQLLPERPESYSWSTEERFVKIHNVVISFLFENCHSPQSDETTMIAAPAHLLKVERMNDLIYSGLQVAKARGQLDLFIERLDAITARGGPPLLPPPQTSEAAMQPPPTRWEPTRSEVIGQQSSAALDVVQASREPFVSLAAPLPPEPRGEDYPH